jgi:hypothetical protein
MFKCVAVAAVMLAGSGLCAANEVTGVGTVQFPGSLNASTATGEPSEPGNVTSTATMTQGVTVVQKGSVFVVGFLDLGLKNDSRGYAWNNGVPMRFGVKLVHIDRHGVLDVAVGAMSEGGHGSTVVHRTASASYWRGWRGDRFASRVPHVLALPGYTYGSTGFLSSREPGNWTTSMSAEQGVTTLRLRSFDAGPFVRGLVGTDSDRHPWNRRTIVDGGVKVSRRLLSGIVEAGYARRHTVSRLDHVSASSNIAFVNLWLGWTPRVIFNR